VVKRCRRPDGTILRAEKHVGLTCFIRAILQTIGWTHIRLTNKQTTCPSRLRLTKLGSVAAAAADRLFNPQTVKENTVAKKSASTRSVYRVTELIGTSESSWEDAAKYAVETATKTLRDLRVAEVNKLDLVIVDGKVAAFRARVNLSFKYEEKD
jgi:dodecin